MPGDRKSVVDKIRRASRAVRDNQDEAKKAMKYKVDRASKTSAEIDAEHHANLPVCPKELHKMELAEERKKWGFFKKIVNGRCFEPLCTIGILGFAAVVGAEVEYMARNPGSDYHIFLALNNAFNTWFAVELVFRMFACRYCVSFFCNQDWKWNWFDFILVFFFVGELAAEIAYQLNPYAKLWVNSIKIFRIVRIIRIFRIVRMLKFIGEVRRMVMSIICSCKMLFWSLMILLLELYVFAVIFVRATVDYTQLDDSLNDDAVKALLDNWGTLNRSLYSLFKTISGGQSWLELADPLLDVHWMYFALFQVYVAVTVFAMLNILTSVFVDAAMESASKDQEFMANDAMEKKERYEKSVKDLFETMDKDGGGSICWEEFERALWDPRMQAYLEALEIEPAHGADLFKLLDHDNSGMVDIKEFLDGCNRVKGNAKAFDIQTVLYEEGKIKSILRTMQNTFSEQLEELKTSVGNVGNAVPEKKSDSNDETREAVQRRLKRLFLVATTPQLLKCESDLQDAIEKAYNEKKAWKQDQVISNAASMEKKTKKDKNEEGDGNRQAKIDRTASRDKRRPSNEESRKKKLPKAKTAELPKAKTADG